MSTKIQVQVLLCELIFYIEQFCCDVYMYIFTLVALVGLESTSYNVSENDGVVEVCAVVYSPDISCPINFAFDVSVTTSSDISSADGSGGDGSASDGSARDGSAGEGKAGCAKLNNLHVLHSSFTGNNNVLGKCIFDACDKRSCVNITIIEGKNESFNVTLERAPDLNSRITLDPVVGLVEITENEGRYDNIDMVMYSIEVTTIISLLKQTLPFPIYFSMSDLVVS